MLTGHKFPRGLGHDYAGIVEAVGPDAVRYSVGDEVFGAAGMKEAGAFAEAMVTDERFVMPKPVSISFEQASTLSIVTVTAWTALIEKAKLRSGQSVFIVGCLGAVGRAGVQIAQMHGATVCGSCSVDGRDEALGLGLREVFNYRDFDPDQLKGRFDTVFDTVAALTMSQSAAMLRRGGHAIYINGFSKQMFLSMFSPRHMSVIASGKPETLAGIARSTAEGKLVQKIGRIVPLLDAIPALAQYEETKLPKGKLVIVP